MTTDTPDLSAAAAALGRKGRSVNSEAQRAASRANGKRGGRPRKETTMRYTVVVKEAGRITSETPDLSQREAERLARTEAEDGGSAVKVFIKWFRASDGQHGYLNPGGNHAITGKSW